MRKSPDSPHKIIDDVKINGVIKSVTEEIDSYGIEISKRILSISKSFLQLEETFNNIKSYNFGLIPYYIAQQLVNYSSSVTDEECNLVGIVDDIISEYIINTVNYRFKDADIHHMKFLVLVILSILCNKDVFMIPYVRTLYEFESIQTVIDVFSMTDVSNLTAGEIIKKIIHEVSKIIDYKDRVIDLYVVKLWIKLYDITEDNYINYKDELGEYFDLVKYTIIIEPPIDADIKELNERLDNAFIKDFENIFCEHFKNLQIPDNNSYNIAKIFDIINNDTNKYDNIYKYKIYIYTSFIIYHPHTMKIPSTRNTKYFSTSLHDVDQITEFLINNVYEDIINFYNFNYSVYNTLEFSQDAWDNWMNNKRTYL